MPLQKIAIIPDGNRRFAKEHHLSLQSAYEQGFSKVKQVSEWAVQEKVKSLGYWALSLENFQKRSNIELKTLFYLMKRQIAQAAKNPEKVGQSDARVRIYGRLDLLPTELQGAMKDLERRTQENDSIDLNIAVAYSGQDEVVHAAASMARDLQQGNISASELEHLSTQALSKYLYFPYSPDLIIRTGRVKRLSGFLPLQSAYSEFYFSDKLWPEFTHAEFKKAIVSFHSTERRFGK